MTHIFTPTTTVMPGSPTLFLAFDYTGSPSESEIATTLTMSVNPEPTSICLAGLGMLVSGGVYLRRKRRASRVACADV